MKLNNQVLSLFTALVISFLFVAKSSAQEGAKSINLLAKALGDIDKDGRPSEKSWRGNRQDFSISKARLSLDSPNSYGRRLLFTDLKLGKECTWSGRVIFDALPTKQNFAYILLADLPQYQTSDKGIRTYEYLALSIFGQGRRNIALVTLKLNIKGDNIKTAQVKLERDHSLLQSPSFDVLDEALDLDFKIRYDYEKGKLSFYLREANHKQWLPEIGTLDWRELLPQEEHHSFGFLLDHTKSFRQAMHFAQLSVTNSSAESNEQPPVDNPNDNEQDKDKDDDKQEETVDKSIILTEVMPNPKAGSAEYIELYNPNDKVIDLTPYQIGIGSNEYKIKKLGLRTAGSIPAKSYLVLSTSPKAVLETYPSCPEASVTQVSLPQMNNKGCYIYLYKDGAVIDGLYYDPKQQPRGLQSKRGIAWEREGLEEENLEDIQWHIGAKSSDYASAGLPNTQGTTEETPNKNQAGKGQDEAKRLQEAQKRLREDKDLVVKLQLYDLTGALLYENEGKQARLFLAKPYSSEAMAQLPAIQHQQTLIVLLNISEPKAKKKSETLTLKAFYP